MSLTNSALHSSSRCCWTVLVDVRLDSNLCVLIEDASKSVFEDLRGRAFAKNFGCLPFGYSFGSVWCEARSPHRRLMFPLAWRSFAACLRRSFGKRPKWISLCCHRHFNHVAADFQRHPRHQTKAQAGQAVHLWQFMQPSRLVSNALTWWVVMSCWFDSVFVTNTCSGPEGNLEWRHTVKDVGT